MQDDKNLVDEGSAVASVSSSALVTSPSGVQDESMQNRIGKKLKENYDIDFDNPMGSGAFSNVFRCTCTKTGKAFALKQIDTRRGPEDPNKRNIAHEVTFMRMLRMHENIMGCRTGGCEFVEPYMNLVLDFFPGGDLIDGLNAHLKARGSLPDAQLAHISRQMVAAILWVHKNSIVHRDVKGENFLSDMRDIGNPSCRVALADFGCAIRLENTGQVLKERMGTPAFWAPEVYAGEYSFNIDMWALGVTICILLAGKLPFDGEREICRPQGPYMSLPLHTTSGCSDFIRACLAPDPNKRIEAAHACQHPWLTKVKPESEVRLERRLLYGSSVCNCSLRFFASICGCCVEVLASGMAELLPGSRRRGSREVLEALAHSEKALEDSTQAFTEETPIASRNSGMREL
jgi:serine/threonine protein kinase